MSDITVFLQSEDLRRKYEERSHAFTAETNHWSSL